MSKFNIGDVVVLKSGGPRMTVEDNRDNIYVAWYETDGFKRDCFPAEALEKHER